MINEDQAYVIVNKTNKLAIVQDETTLAEVINQLTIDITSCAVAVNNDIVARQQWQCHVLNNGDCINVFGAIAGG